MNEQILRANGTEKFFQNEVKKLAKRWGWEMFHQYDSRKSTPGWPDCAFAHSERREFFVAELKKPSGTCTKAQRKWIDTLDAAGVETYVWRFKHWPEIVERLSE